MKFLRYGIWAIIFVLAGFLAFSTVGKFFNNDNKVAGLISIGGPFTALAANGSPITHDDLKGRPHVLFFGFTNCPDICPTTLYEAGEWLKALGPDGDKLDIYFVTVDPKHDTPEMLSTYLTAFDKRIKGITGSEEQIADIVKKWRVYAEKVDTGDGDYTMNHTASTFLMKANGEFFGTIAYGEQMDVAKGKLERLVKS
jgi:protein SCO1/2